MPGEHAVQQGSERPSGHGMLNYTEGGVIQVWFVTSSIDKYRNVIDVIISYTAVP
jgi:hypothetical protein